MAAPTSDASGPGFTLNRLITLVIAGIVCGFVAIVISIGNGSLVFAVHDKSFLPASVGPALFATAVMAVVAALTSSIRGGVPTVQEVSCVALGVVVGAVGDALPVRITEADRYQTVMVAVFAATLITGVGFFLLGYFRLGGVIRYIPYSVIGSFLAGTGWLICLGGLGIILGEPATLTIFVTPPQPEAILRLGLAALFVAVLIFVRTRSSNPFAMPAVILVAVVLFVAIAFGSGYAPDDLRAGGWLIDVPEGGRIWPAIDLTDFSGVDWRAVAVAMVNTPLLIIVSAVAFLLNATGIEMESGDDVELDRELSSVGVMNLASGIGGGLPGFHAISVTLLATHLRAASRWVGIIVGAVAAAALFLGDIVLSVIPTLVLGGMLLWIGGQLLVEWVITAYRRLDLWEYLIILVIFLIIVAVGFAVGIVVGIIAAVLLFVLQYSRVDIVRHEMTGLDYQSNVDAPPARSALLNASGQAILIVKLQGFLFFGTADRLRRRVQEHVKVVTEDTVGFLLIDFRRVTGIDASTVLSFIRLSQIAKRHGFTVVLTGLPDAVHAAFVRGGLEIGETGSIRIEADIERGMKWCEDALIAHLKGDTARDTQPLTDTLIEIVSDAGAAETVADYCTRVVAPSGTRLITQGEPSVDIFVVESGQATVEMASGTEAPTYLATVVAGAVVGEIAFYLGEPRSASVVADNDMVVWRLSQEAILRLQSEAPTVALRFHRGMAAMLSQRLSRTNRLLSFLAD